MATGAEALQDTLGVARVRVALVYSTNINSLYNKSRAVKGVVKAVQAQRWVVTHFEVARASRP